MNKSDKYYLKSGKLELSMLDDEEDTVPVVQAESKKELLDQLEFEHTKRLRKKSLTQPKLKVSREVYHTLHTMGQFLTGQDEKSTMAEPKKTIISAKEQRLQKIASSIQVQEEIPPMPLKKPLPLHDEEILSAQSENVVKSHHQAQAEGLRDYMLQKQADSLKKDLKEEGQDLSLLQALKADDTPIYESRQEVSQMDKTYDSRQEASLMHEAYENKHETSHIDKVYERNQQVNQADKVYDIEQEDTTSLETLDEEQVHDEIERETEDVLPLEMYKPLSRDNVLGKTDGERSLEQENIDLILESFFRGKQSRIVLDSEVRALKKHIQKQIEAIQSYS